jgi:hypothetical protein
MKKIVLVYPPVTNKERYGSILGEACSKALPLGLYYVASYMQNRGYSVKVFDGEALDYDEPTLCRDVLKNFCSK